jgi:hypothetical protein
MVRTIPPLAGVLSGIETDNKLPIRAPISLQHFNGSAANKVGTPRCSKIGRNGLSISRVDFRIIHCNFHDEERGQFVTLRHQNVPKITLSRAFDMLQVNSPRGLLRLLK